jgi:hypothetical protein
MRHLLTLAEMLCGSTTRELVFEPLVADWHREWSRSTGLKRIVVLIRGFTAFALTLLQCAARDFTTPPPAASVLMGSAAFVIAMLFATAMVGFSLSLIPYFLDFNRMPIDFLIVTVLVQGASLALAPALLPSTMLLRRDARTTWRHGVQWVAAGVLLSMVVVFVAFQNRSGLWVTASQNERMYQLALANDQAGRYQYPGTARRQSNPTTPEQRAERFEQYKLWLAQQVSQRAVPPAPTTVLEKYQSTVLVVVFGLMGWALGELGRPTVTRAFAWWAIVCLAQMAVWFVDRFSLTQWHPPLWFPLVAFGLAAIALQIASARGVGAQAPQAP